MNGDLTIESVWEALEDDPVRARNLRLRSKPLMRIAEELRVRELRQARADRGKPCGRRNPATLPG